LAATILISLSKNLEWAITTFAIVTEFSSLPLKPDLKYTQRPGQYPIPNDYQIEAFWGRNEKNHVQSSIDYVEGTPYFKIKWIHNEQNYIIVSQTSPSDAFNKYCNVRYFRKNTAISGILIFGLQLYEELTKVVPKKNRPRFIKPLSDLSNSSHRKKIKKAGKSLFNDFEKKKKIWHPTDNPRLKELVLEAGEQPWLIKFEED
ncbi:6257_t:CDS:2, partial [Cetraspora pellucida]